LIGAARFAILDGMGIRSLTLELESVSTAARLRRGVILAGLFLAGLALGVVLTIVTVVLPRKRELARVDARSMFYASFDPRSAVQSASPASVEVLESQDDHDRYGALVGRKWFAYRCRVPSKQQANFIQTVTSGVQSMMRPMSGISRRQMAWAYVSQSHTNSGASSQYDSRTLTYQAGKDSGNIHLWASSQGDEMLLLISIAEP
jgi:hypothetical protein